jgi:hypothetical protein
MKYLVIVLFMMGTLGNNNYTIKLIDGYVLSFEILFNDIQFSEEKWQECNDLVCNKYEKIFKNKNDEYIGKLTDSYCLKFSNKNDLIKSFPNEVVLFRGKSEKTMHPFLILNKEDIMKVKNSSILNEFELHRKKGVFNECYFYKLNDGRVLAISKEGNDGELFRNTDDLLVYYSFIEGFEFKIVIGIKK